MNERQRITTPNWDKNSWIAWPEYVAFFAEAIGTALALDRDSRVLDLGCGRANISREIAKRFQLLNAVDAVDPSETLVSARGCPLLSITVSDALSFLQNTSENRYDAVILKQVVHCFSSEERRLVFAEILRVLSPTGRCLVALMPPTSPIPMFPRAEETFAVGQLDFRALTQELASDGFSLDSEHSGILEFPVTLSREAYFALIRERFISNLQPLSESELESGIRWLSQRFPGLNISFVDRLHSLVFLPGASARPIMP